MDAGWARRSWWLPAGLLLLTGVFYLNSLDNGFHYDDSHSIVENYHIRSLARIPDFFADPKTFSREPAMAMYRPVLQTTYALNYALGKYQPLGYHLVNIALHGLAALLVYLVVSGLTGQRVLGWWGGGFFCPTSAADPGGELHQQPVRTAERAGGADCLLPAHC
jgi:hypothetical protein